MISTNELEQELLQLVQIDPERIQEAFCQLPADLVRWNQIYADVLREHLIQKARVDSTFHRLNIEHRERIIAQGGKATEAMVTAAVETDPEWSSVKLAAIEAEVEKARVNGVCESIRARRDMLISLGSHVRVEMENDPVLRERTRGRKLVDG